MKTEDRIQILKFLFMLVNALFVIIGISLFGCSAWILFDQTNFVTVLSDEQNFKVVAGALFVMGLLVMVVFMLGCVGVHLENRCLIVSYMIFLIAIVFGQVFVIFLSLVKKDTINTFLTRTVEDLIISYGNTSHRLLDRVQQSAKCCGGIHSSDWQKNNLIQNMSDVYPCSCFNGSCPVLFTNEMYSFGNGSHIYSLGCEKKLKDWLETNIFLIVGMDLGLIVIQVLHMVVAVKIFQNISLKIKERHSKNLLNTMEVSTEAGFYLPQSNQGYFESASHTYDQQLDNANHQEYAGQGSYQHQYQDQQYQYHYSEPNGQIFDQNRYNMYDQENAAQSYGQYQQHYNIHVPIVSNYNHTFNNGYDQYGGQTYAQYQDQPYQHEGLMYTQTQNSNYNQGYVQNYNYQ